MRRVAVVLTLIVTAVWADEPFPDTETARALVMANVDGASGELQSLTVDSFCRGQDDDHVLAVARLNWGYYSDVYVVAFAKKEGVWTYGAAGDSVMYLPDYGGDAGSLARACVGAHTYYAFTCTESSYGSGMGSDYDYFYLYGYDGETLTKAFEGNTRAHEEFFSRWYGGEDSTAWTDGGVYDEVTEYRFEDVNDDGTFELWALSRQDIEDGIATKLEARLYTRAGEGSFEEATPAFAGVLLEKPTAEGYLALGRESLVATGDAAAALGYYEKAVALDADCAPSLKKQIDFLKRIQDDPPEAVRLFFAQELQDVITGYADAEVGVEATVSVGGLPALLTVIKERKADPRWKQAYANAVAETTYYDGEDEGRPTKKDLDVFKKDWGLYRERESDAEERAKTATRLADSYRKCGDYKTAADFYRFSLAEDAESVFEDYNYYRLGEAAAVNGDTAAALDWYVKTMEADDWWSYASWDNCVNYCAVNDGGAWRSFLDALSEVTEYTDTTYIVGQLDDRPGQDLVVIVTTPERRGYLYYFLREKEEFRGGAVPTSAGFLWPGKLYGGESAGVVSVREIDERENDRTTFETFYRYDGEGLKPVAHVKVADQNESDGDYEYTAQVEYVAGETPSLRMDITETRNGLENRRSQDLYWDPSSFAFTERPADNE